MNTEQLTWTVVPFSELTVDALHELLRLRVDVFVVEQRCVYPEIDGQDPLAHHVLGRDAEGTLVAYARILPPSTDGHPHIGRVVVHPQHRGHQLARSLMKVAMENAQRIHGDPISAVAAQTYLAPFYASLGYTPTSEPYMWDGIEHVDMVLNV